MAKTEQRNRLAMRGSSVKDLKDDDKSSKYGSESEVNGNAVLEEKPVDKYGFTGGAQQYSAETLTADNVRRFSRKIAFQEKEMSPPSYKVHLDSVEEIPIEVLRQREAKWLEMLNSWDKWMAKKHKKIKERCQKGIPPSLRGRAWLYLTGGKVKREQNKGKFQELDDQPGDTKWVDIIERDLHRQFPFHEMFSARGGHGQKDLFRVLKAYTLHRPEEGYCQAQAPVAAVLLMHMPAEDAFWVLIQICEKYLPGYYSKGLEALQLDGEILHALLKKVCPIAHRHLENQKLGPILYMTEWFMCAFSRTLPWASVLRVWDMFLCEGVKILFRVGLVLLKCTLGSQEKLKSCLGLYETMELLKAIPPQYLQEGFLVHEIIELSVSEKDIEKEHRSQLRLWLESHGELHCKSPPRMHGARAVMAAEPPSKQDLKERPNIIVASPLFTVEEKLGDNQAKRRSKKDKEKVEEKNRSEVQDGVNSHIPPKAPSPLLSAHTEQGSNESLSSAEHDTYL